MVKGKKTTKRTEVEVDLASLKKIRSHLNVIIGLLEEATEQSKELEKKSFERKDFILTIKQDLNKLGNEINEKFLPAINLLTKIYERLEAFRSPQALLLKKIKQLFQNIEEHIEFDRKQIDKDVLNHFEVRLEVELVDRIESVFIDYRTDVEKIMDLFNKFKYNLTFIQDSVTELKDRPYAEFEFLKLFAELNDSFFPLFNQLIEKSLASADDLSVEIIQRITEILEDPDLSLEDLRLQLSSMEEKLQDRKAVASVSSEKMDEVEGRMKIMEDELYDVRQFLEKNPRYQLLYLIHNFDTISFNELNELSKTDPALIKVLLNDLSEEGFITLTGKDDDLTIQIKKKLNPLSCIELDNVFENQLVQDIRNSPDKSSFNKAFDELLKVINKYKDENKEEAGYLMSVLYLFIHKTKNSDLLKTITPLFEQLSKDSFYVRLVENALNPFEGDLNKFLVVEGLQEYPKLYIFDDKKRILNKGDDKYHTNGPFEVTKIIPLSGLNKNQELELDTSNFSKHTDMDDVAKWVWLTGQGDKFKIQVKDSEGKEKLMYVSTSKSLDDLLIKNLMGSVSHAVGLQLLESIEDLDKIYVKIVFLHRKRKLNEIIVDNLLDLVDQLADFWEDEAKLAIYPRKIAAWISDYLQDLGYTNFDFNTVLEAIKAREAETEAMEQAIQLVKIEDPEVKPILKKLEIELPKENKEEFLAQEIEKHKVKVPKTLESGILFVDPNGKISAIKQEQDIVTSDNVDSELVSTTVFENPFDVAIKDVQINSIVPFGYKVVGYNTTGFEGIEPKKDIMDDGLRLTWTIPEVQPRQEAKIELNLKRRIARTIMMNIEDEISVINTYFNIEPEEEIYSASNSYSNINSSNVDTLIIEDEIPNTFKLIDAKPFEDTYSVKMEDENLSQYIKWRYSSIETGKMIKHLYHLTSNVFYIINNFTVKSEANGEPVMKIIRILEPNLIFKELVVSYYCEFYQPFSEVYIKESVPESMDITLQYPVTAQRTIEIMQDKMKQIWKIIPRLHTNNLNFAYICSGDIGNNEFPIEVQVKDFETSKIQEISMDSKTKSFFVPHLHAHVQKNKKMK